MSKNIRDEIKNVLSGKSQVRHGTAIYAAYRHFRRKEGSGSESKRGNSGSAGDQILADYVNQNNFWFQDELDLSNYIDRGMEQKVYEDPSDPNFVLKINTGFFYESDWKKYFSSLLLHNYFFPDTTYELVGFINIQHRILPVVRQPYVKSDSNTDISQIEDFLKEQRFIRISHRMNSYKSTEIGITLTDLSPYNVLTKGGVLRFIDTIFFVDDDSLEDTEFENGGDISLKNNDTMENNSFLGGELHGPSHAQGGIDIITPEGKISAEGGETILNKRSMASEEHVVCEGTPKEVASKINELEGGVSFSPGGTCKVVSKAANGKEILKGKKFESITQSKAKELFGSLVKIKDIPSIKNGDYLGFKYWDDSGEIAEIGIGEVGQLDDTGSFTIDSYSFIMNKSDVWENKNNPEFELEKIDNSGWRWSLYHIKDQKKAENGTEVSEPEAGSDFSINITQSDYHAKKGNPYVFDFEYEDKNGIKSGGIISFNYKIGEYDFTIENTYDTFDQYIDGANKSDTTNLVYERLHNVFLPQAEKHYQEMYTTTEFAHGGVVPTTFEKELVKDKLSEFGIQINHIRGEYKNGLLTSQEYAQEKHDLIKRYMPYINNAQTHGIKINPADVVVFRAQKGVSISDRLAPTPAPLAPAPRIDRERIYEISSMNGEEYPAWRGSEKDILDYIEEEKDIIPNYKNGDNWETSMFKMRLRVLEVDPNKEIETAAHGTIIRSSDASVRPSPSVSATVYDQGYTMEGNDGNKWEIHVSEKGIHRWVKVRAQDGINIPDGNLTEAEEAELTELINYKSSLKGQAALDFANKKDPKYTRFKELVDKHVKSDKFGKSIGILKDGGELWFHNLSKLETRPKGSAWKFIIETLAEPFGATNMKLIYETDNNYVFELIGDDEKISETAPVYAEQTGLLYETVGVKNTREVHFPKDKLNDLLMMIKYPLLTPYKDGGEIYEAKDGTKYWVGKGNHGKWTVFSESASWKERDEFGDTGGLSSESDATDIAKSRAGIEPEEDREMYFMQHEYAGGGKIPNGKITVTKIEDIPNLQEKVDSGHVTYRGIGLDKLAKEFYKLTGESGTRITVDGKEYFITDTDYRKLNWDFENEKWLGKIKFSAPHRKYAGGGEIEGIKLEYAKEDVDLLEQQGDLAIVDTQHGVLWGVYSNDSFTFSKNDGNTLFTGNKEEAIEFVKNAYTVEKDTFSKGGLVSNLEEYKKETLDYLKKSYGLGANDLDINDDSLKQAMDGGETPTEYIDYLADKYGMDKIMANGGPVPNSQKNKEIAAEIISQLGGIGRLNVMTGAYNFVAIDNGVQFQIKNPKANVIKIQLNSKDLYDLEIGRMRGLKYSVVHMAGYLPNDVLKKELEKGTGMDFSLGDMGKKADNGAEITNALKDFNTDQLDPLEQMQYNHFIQSMPKEEALQILINNVEGDYTQLSDGLAEIAQKQDPQAADGAQIGGCGCKHAADGAVISNLEIELEALPNPDHGADSIEGTINIKKHKVKVNNISEAVALVHSFIEENNLGAGNFSGGQLYENGKIIGKISYNGRVWDINDNPMKYGKGGHIGFDALSRKVASRYAGKHVAPPYQYLYGKTYDKTEASEVGDKVAAKVYRQKTGHAANGAEIPGNTPLPHESGEGQSKAHINKNKIKIELAKIKLKSSTDFTIGDKHLDGYILFLNGGVADESKVQQIADKINATTQFKVKRMAGYSFTEKSYKYYIVPSLISKARIDGIFKEASAKYKTTLEKLVDDPKPVKKFYKPFVNREQESIKLINEHDAKEAVQILVDNKIHPDYVKRVGKYKNILKFINSYTYKEALRILQINPQAADGMEVEEPPVHVLTDVLKFPDFKQKLPDIKSPYVREEDAMYKARYDQYSGKMMYFKHGRRGSNKMSVPDAYTRNLYTENGVSWNSLSPDEKKQLFGEEAKKYKFEEGGILEL